MKMLSLPFAALALASSLALTTGVQAAPAYTQIDCMQPDGGPSGCWRDGRDYGPYSRGFGVGQSRQYAPAASEYRDFFDDRTPAQAYGSTNGNAQYYGTGH